MADDYALQPVDHQPEFDHSLQPVDHQPDFDPFAAAAARVRQSVKPEGGRQEGALTKVAENYVPYKLGQLASIPQDAFEAHDRYMKTGVYEPGPMLAAAALPMGLSAPFAEANAVGVFGGRLAATTDRAGVGSELQGIKAYHGSPHDFDAFDMSKIGTGEGAQAYGHGLYFAENEGVAQSYRDALSKQVTYKGEPLNTHPMDSDVETAKHSIASVVANGGNPKGAIINQASEWRTAAEGYARHADNKSLPEATREAAKQQAESFNNIAKEIEKFDPVDFAKNPGKMYEVNIKADPEHFLDWDKPLSEQPQSIRDAMVTKNASALQQRLNEVEAQKSALAADRLKPSNTMRDEKGWHQLAKEAEQLQNQLRTAVTEDLTGQVAYRRMHEAAIRSGKSEPAKVKEQQVAQRLNEAGIPGIKYLDQGSRSGEKGTYNYVVNNDKLIDIVKKYAVAGIALPPTIAAAYQQQFKPVDGDPFK